MKIQTASSKLLEDEMFDHAKRAARKARLMRRRPHINPDMAEILLENIHELQEKAREEEEHRARHEQRVAELL